MQPGSLRPRSRRSSNDQAHCARLTVPGRVRPGDCPRPGESALSQRTGTLCPPGSAQQMPAGGPPPTRQDVVSQRSGTLCPPGSDSRSGLAVHRRPANGRTPSDQTHCARPRTTSRSVPAVHRRPANDQAPGDQAHWAHPRPTRRSVTVVRRRPADARATPADGHAVPAWRWPGGVVSATGQAAPWLPGACGGGEARSRRRSRSTWSVASRGSVSIPAAVSTRLSPKDTRFSEQTRASNQFFLEHIIHMRFLNVTMSFYAGS
jgi:hypothetical protein